MFGIPNEDVEYLVEDLQHPVLARRRGIAEARSHGRHCPSVLSCRVTTKDELEAETLTPAAIGQSRDAWLTSEPTPSPRK
jgi:hypothetical protein